ncbi:MAG TPA: lytic transglycosylase domain-containing protein [Candidatus Eremiobacteraceae bacterium]|nr:lytic transglycosylase domain-containing protein [Candidatus Eremiobacteraceae bacterium]
MNMAPNDVTGMPEQPRRTLPIAMRPWPPVPASPSSAWLDPQGTPADSVPAPPAAQGASPELSLSKLIAQLSRQLKSIEQTFTKALQQLAKSVESAPSSPSSSAAAPSGTAPRGANPYDGMIRRTAQRHDLDPALLNAVIRQESGFNPQARSSAGAMGLMQLMPDTAKSLGVTDAFDPAQNLEGGAKLLRGLIDQYGGRLDLALAAYNAGSGAVDKYHGVPPFAETRNYVHAILDDYKASALRA